MGMAISIWLECLVRSETAKCILSLGDNTSAFGWLFGSSHVNPTSLTFNAIQLVDRKVATLIMDSPHCLALQHIKGDLRLYRTAKWSHEGKLAGSRSTPVVGGTVRTAASSLAAAFRNDHPPSPLHHEVGTTLCSVFRALL
jgi:hypothetical protein